jgi:hypothetical protein
VTEIINEPLHLLFHDLSGPIGTINTMSQICASYITRFNMEKLEGEFKDNLAITYNSIFSCRNTIAEKLKLVVGALTGIGSRDIGDTLQKYIDHGLKNIKDIEESSGKAFNRLLENDTKQNLLEFGEEVRKFNPICQSMVEAMSMCKDNLTALGKY